MCSSEILLSLTCVWFFLFATGFDPEAHCYVEVSDGVCYYYTETGYDCSRCDPQQEDCPKEFELARRALPACSAVGQCFVPIDNNEVCYYTPPYGYDCYHIYDPHIVGNLTHCDELKPNAPPEIDFPGGSRTAYEDWPTSIPWVQIYDPDANEGLASGNGYLLVNMQITFGTLGFYPDLMAGNTASNPSVPQMQAYTDAKHALEPTTARTEGVTWKKGNGSWAEELMFEARLSTISVIMKALYYKSNPNFNSAQAAQLSRLALVVDDQGNSGGSAESAAEQTFLDVQAVNDPPVVTSIPLPGSTDEDTVKPIATLDVSDIDFSETPNAKISVKLEVKKGTLLINGNDLAGLNPASDILFTDEDRQLRVQGTPAQLNQYLRQLEYSPNKDANDLTPAADPLIETLTITANDGGATGNSLTYGGSDEAIYEFEIRVNPSNDAPVIEFPVPQQLDEDTATTSLAVVVNDVDTTTGLALTVTVANGVLTVTTAFPGLSIGGSGSNTLTVTGASLTDINSIFASCSYTPTQDFNGDEELTVAVNDNKGGVTTNSTIIKVVAVNDQPIVVWKTSLPTDPIMFRVGKDRDMRMRGGAGTGVASSPTSDVNGPAFELRDVDVNDDPTRMVMQVLLVCFAGELNIGDVTGLDFMIDHDDDGRILLFTGRIDDVNNALTTVDYTRTEDDEIDNFIIAISDIGNFGKEEGTTDGVKALHDVLDISIVNPTVYADPFDPANY